VQEERRGEINVEQGVEIGVGVVKVKVIGKGLAVVAKDGWVFRDDGVGLGEEDSTGVGVAAGDPVGGHWGREGQRLEGRVPFRVSCLGNEYLSTVPLAIFVVSYHRRRSNGGCRRGA